MTGKPLPYLDDSPELRALIDELVALRIRQAGLWKDWNVFLANKPRSYWQK
ncbi:MAG: hypothetical protein ACFFD4_00140 [Candidatus Odinarchaeota archaeon]